jgi:Calcineurin-like phosphoesterase
MSCARWTYAVSFVAPIVIVYVVYHLQLQFSFALPTLQVPLSLVYPFTSSSSHTPHASQSDTSRNEFTRHIVAVGDLHGDLPNAERVLRFSGVVDDFGDWSGNVDVFVQTGDIIDRHVKSSIIL